MTLRHYAAASLTTVHDCDPARGIGGIKPCGLWVSVGDAWEQWCRGADFGIDRLQVVHEVSLVDHARILIGEGRAIHTLLNRDYGYRRWRYDAGVRWADVAQDYDGIIINPYIKDWTFCANASTWYYSWDCSSGCIWRARAVASIQVKEGQHEHAD